MIACLAKVVSNIACHHGKGKLVRNILAITAAFFFASQACLAAEIIPMDRWYGEVLWSPDGTKIAVKTYPRALERGKPIPYHGFIEKTELVVLNSRDYSVISKRPGQVLEFCWSPDGKQMYIEDFHQLLLADPLTGATIRKIGDGTLGSCMWSKDSKRLLVYGFQKESISIVEARSNRQIAIEGLKDLHPSYLSWAPNEKLVAFSQIDNEAFHGHYISNKTPSILSICDCRTGKVIQSWKRSGNVRSMVWTPDMRMFIFSEPGYIRFYSARNYKEIAFVETSNRDGVGFRFSPDKSRLLFVEDGWITEVDLAQFKKTRLIEGPSDGHCAFGFSPDGKLLAILQDETLALGDPLTGKYLCWTKIPNASYMQWNAKLRVICLMFMRYSPHFVHLAASAAPSIEPLLVGGTQGAPNWFGRVHLYTVEDAIKAFDKGLSAKEKVKFKELDERKVGYYGGGSFILDDMMAKVYSTWDWNELQKWFDSRGTVDPRDVTGIVLHSYWLYLNGKPLQVEQEIKDQAEAWDKESKGRRMQPLQKINSEPAKTEATSDK